MTASAGRSGDEAGSSRLKAKRLGVETLQDAHAFIHRDSHVCRAEGLSAHNRISVGSATGEVTANLYPVTGDFLAKDEIGLSEWAWTRLGAHEGDLLQVKHAAHTDSLSQVRSKIYGHKLGAHAFDTIIADVEAGRYSTIHLSEFLTACAARPLAMDEMRALTDAMVKVGDRIDWNKTPIMDKHSVGGLPGNRTTPIVVAIVAACGLTIPKTSSRAITSPAGTADTMETLAPVDLNLQQIRSVIEREGGCIVWGGAVRLSPTDDILIRVERELDLDAEGQLVASILSKKIAAGATHLVLDLPVGATAKVRSLEAARSLSRSLSRVGADFGLKTSTVFSDGSQPVGRGVGPALEARDVLTVLQGDRDAPADLAEHALALAAAILELGGAAAAGDGMRRASETLNSGAAWAKFQRICDAQGGMRTPPTASHQRPVTADRTGIVDRIDNRRLSRVAKLAGAPEDKAAGLEVHVRIGDCIVEGQPIYTVHAAAPGDIEYALEYARRQHDIVGIATS